MRSSAKQSAFSKVPSGGFTLIELVVFILVVGLFMPVIMSAFIVGFKDRDVPIVSLKASLLVDGLVDEISVRRFDEIEHGLPYDGTEAWTLSINLGRDVGEAAGNADAFDDVDDFIGFQRIVTDDDFGDFTLRVTSIYYVSDAIVMVGNNTAARTDLDTPLVGDDIYSDFKRVTIEIEHELLGTQEFVTLFATEAGKESKVPPPPGECDG